MKNINLEKADKALEVDVSYLIVISIFNRYS